MYNSDRLVEHLEDALKVYDKDYFVIAVQGSQNYGIDDELSDVDSKLLLLPSVDDLVYNKQAVSHTHLMSNDEHVDCKDLREYFKVMRKMNTNFLEILYADAIVNGLYSDSWNELIDNRELITHANPYQFMKCCLGMVHQKATNMLKDCPCNQKDLAEWGYSSKDLSHIVRIYDTAYRYANGESFDKCLKNDSSYYSYMIKRHLCDDCRNVDEAISMRDKFVDKMIDLELKYNSNRKSVYDKDADELLNKVLKDICVNFLRKELC